MNVTVNGKSEILSSNASLTDLLMMYEHDENVVVAEHNGTVIPAPAFAQTVLRDGDVIELVHFVGGG